MLVGSVAAGVLRAPAGATAALAMVAAQGAIQEVVAQADNILGLRVQAAVAAVAPDGIVVLVVALTLDVVVVASASLGRAQAGAAKALISRAAAALEVQPVLGLVVSLAVCTVVVMATSTLVP